MEIAPGVHQILLESPYNPKFSVFCYLLDGPNGAALVDCGWGAKNSLDVLKAKIADTGVRFESIDTLVMTHLHPDHFGLAGTLKMELGCKVLFHELEKTLVETRYRSYSKLLDSLSDWLLSYGAPEEEVPELQTASVGMRRFVMEVEADQVVVGGEILKLGGRDWEVIWTPGHSRGHVCLFNRETACLISGDHVLPGITPNVSLNPESGENPLGDYLASLRKIIDLPVSHVLPGHERAFTGLAQRIRHIENHHDERLAHMMSALTDQPRTGYYVASQIAWTIGEFSGFDVWARRAAMMETLAHLEYLRRQGRVEKLLVEGVFHYRPH